MRRKTKYSEIPQRRGLTPQEVAPAAERGSRDPSERRPVPAWLQTGSRGWEGGVAAGRASPALLGWAPLQPPPRSHFFLQKASLNWQRTGKIRYVHIQN